jgi:hypothetical protein
MSNDCKHKNPCGCNDSAQTTPPPCNEAAPCTGEPCSEVFCQECISYCNDTFSIDLGGASPFTISQGDRLDYILQKLLIQLSGAANCINTAALALHSTLILEDQIDVEWIGSAADQYKVTYKDVSTGVSVDSPDLAVGVSSYSIQGLVPASTYEILVTNLTDNCESVTITVKTKTI